MRVRGGDPMREVVMGLEEGKATHRGNSGRCTSDCPATAGKCDSNDCEPKPAPGVLFPAAMVAERNAVAEANPSTRSPCDPPAANDVCAASGQEAAAQLQCAELAGTDGHADCLYDCCTMSAAAGCASSTVNLQLAELPIPTPTTAAPTSHCSLTAGANTFSLITKGDATVSSHSHYGGLAIGGTLTDGTSTQDGTVGGDSWANVVASWTGTAAFTTGAGIPFDWSQFEELAASATNSEAGGFKVVVVDDAGVYDPNGGTGTAYTTYDFRSGGQGEDNGKTIVVFSGAGTIVLTKTSDGRQFGPSVLAPFAHVVVDGEVGFVDGTIIAKSYSTTGQNSGSVQLHADGYDGTFECEEPAAPTTAAPTTASTGVQ